MVTVGVSIGIMIFFQVAFCGMSYKLSADPSSHFFALAVSSCCLHYFHLYQTGKTTAAQVCLLQGKKLHFFGHILMRFLFSSLMFFVNKFANFVDTLLDGSLFKAICRQFCFSLEFTCWCTQDLSLLSTSCSSLLSHAWWHHTMIFLPHTLLFPFFPFSSSHTTPYTHTLSLSFRIQSSSFTNMDHINFEDKWDMFRLWVRFLYFSTTTFSTGMVLVFERGERARERENTCNHFVNTECKSAPFKKKSNTKLMKKILSKCIDN